MRIQQFSAVLVTALLAAASIAACDSGPGDDMPEDGSDTLVAGTVRIVKGENGPQFPDVKLDVGAPKEGEVVTADSMIVRAVVGGIELTAPTEGEQSKGINFSKEGQHVHVIIDNEPYKAMYNADSFNVGKLAPGVHTLRAFPSRSWHESVKVPTAFVARTFYVGAKTTDSAPSMSGPLLTYSRPKGEYKGKDAERVLLDFFVTGTTLAADGHKVIVAIDGVAADTLTDWVPYFIEGLADGEHKIALTLVDAGGQTVPGVYNSTSRTITIARGAAAAAPHH